MSSSRPARRAPLLLLVFGVFLAIVGITATAQTALLSLHFSTASLNTVVGGDAATIRAVLQDAVSPAALDPDRTLSSAARTRLEGELAALAAPSEIIRVELLRVDGSVVAAGGSGGAVSLADPGAVRTAAAPGAPPGAWILEAGGNPGVAALAVPAALHELLPITVEGTTLGVVAIWRDAGPVLARLEGVRRDVVTVTVSAAIIAAAVLYLIFRAAQTRISRQTLALVEATRRDPLTDTLNHGALVGHLAEAIELARADGTTLGVALVDLDNFRLLNEHHGHPAGNEALLAVVGALRRNVPDGIVMGRSGPDEFLLIADARTIVELEPALERLRTALTDLSLEFAGTERLPITISAGLATYPAHGSSATNLLATVARTLEEAKASGGDAIRLAARDVADEPPPSGLDVLQGLVRAVDTKDRYTKRHSDDVARYAAFLAERLDLDPAFVGSIRVAGLLHDVGKIGVPDAILRKPGKLTEAEAEAVRQHVALGDLIVRDVPDVDIVRAGVRHHHERWDGAGYLDRLAGEEIPLIARILAVADTFSAMTTSRPYRKALDVREALTRLGDAAGSQLDERLVRAFIDGIETAADPPLPEVAGRPRLWTPRVA